MMVVEGSIPFMPTMTMYLDWNEFRDAGYLQEVNRRFFHPLGLALAVNFDEGVGVTGVAGIIDVRDDPEGFIFGSITEDMIQKSERIDSLFEEKRSTREAILGDVIQPL